MKPLFKVTCAWKKITTKSAPKRKSQTSKLDFRHRNYKHTHKYSMTQTSITETTKNHIKYIVLYLHKNNKNK